MLLLKVKFCHLRTFHLAFKFVREVGLNAKKAVQEEKKAEDHGVLMVQFVSHLKSVIELGLFACFKIIAQQAIENGEICWIQLVCLKKRFFARFWLSIGSRSRCCVPTHCRTFALPCLPRSLPV